MGSYGSFCLVFCLFVCLFVCFLCFCFVSFFGRGEGSVSKMASISVKSPGTPYCFPFWLNP